MLNDAIFLDIAKDIANGTTCASMGVGAVIVRENRIISHGYNGVPSGHKHCNEIWNGRSPEHSKWSEENEIHAEMNAIIYAAREGLAINGSTMYITHTPCRQCLKHMAASGIVRIVCAELYVPVNSSIESAKKTYFDALKYTKASKIDMLLVEKV